MRLPALPPLQGRSVGMRHNLVRLSPRPGGRMHLHSQIEADVTRTPTTPLAAYISDYLIACEAGSAMKRPLSARTIACYRKAMRELDHLMGGADLSGFTEARVASIISAKRKTSASNARLLAAVSKAFSTWLYRKHHTGGNRLE